MSKILILEDDEGVRGFLKLGLKQFGYTVVAVGTAEDCLEAFEQDTWNLVICDMHMPFKSGMDAILEILDQQPNQSILAISGVPSSAVRHTYLNTAMMVGVRDYLVKPFTLHELKNSVEKLLNSNQKSSA